MVDRPGSSGTGHGADPLLVELAADLADAARAAARQPFVVGLVGAVAAGKTTMAGRLAELMATAGPPLQVAVVATDSFLLSNAELEPLGGAMVKGYPQSYDWPALQRFLAAASGGAGTLSVPRYSHDLFDVVPGVQDDMASPDVLVVEGLNLLQAPPVAPVDLVPLLDRSIYLEVATEDVARWFVDRFLDVTAQAHDDPRSFYAMFAGMERAEVEAIARWTWDEINAPNLVEHIAPTRARADLVLHLGADHSVQRVERSGTA